jgi:hypothetical protein
LRGRQIRKTGENADWIVLAAVAPIANNAMAQTTSIKTDYLTTYKAPPHAPYAIDNSSIIVNVKSDGGWAKGLRDQRQVHSARR